MSESGINGILKIAVRIIMTIVFGIVGYQVALFTLELKFAWMKNLPNEYIWVAFSILFFALCGFIATHFVWWTLKKTGQIFENMLQNVSIPDIVAAICGLIVSLLLANLIAIPFIFINIPGVGFYITIALNMFFAFVGIRAFLKRRDDVWGMILGIVGKSGRITHRRAKGIPEAMAPRFEAGGYSIPLEHSWACEKVLDTSALIDGRILDIANTGFLEGNLTLPRFVLTELQGVADSSDPARRTRGRKGLTVVSELQKIKAMVVSIVDVSMRELKRDKVDEALVELCKKMGAKIVTTDYNLNQIARIEGVKVLNVNDLANAMKPQFLPGDMVKIDIIRPGKEHGQGVGYLEDGTMLVVEDGEDFIGATSDVVITSMLQTSAGRMVFGKIRR
ncbi:MAG: twitching motility protein PilT [Synergistaceae bacterium]|nr:twitching motility protein PilT [Synergistaceae bacterium]